MPFALALGLGAVGGRFGVAVPLDIAPRLTIIPSAGASVIAIAGRYNAGALPGWNTGLVLVSRDRVGSGVRVGATWHRFGYDRRPVLLVELGFVSANREAGAPDTPNPAR